MYDTIDIEDRNKPAVAMVNKDFAFDAKSAASGQGIPGVRTVSESIPCECRIMEVVEAGINEVTDDIVAALTQPLTTEESSPKPKKVEKLQRIIFKGDLEEVNRFFYRRGWTDGLPIIPPTEQAVEEMLRGTDLPSEHVVGKVIPRLGKATVEKIAINAVMAGALPTYMPLLIAGVQVLMDPKSVFGHCGVSTGSFAPFWFINGPIRNDLKVNGGTGALSPGDIANAAIGRAMGLIIKNIGGVRKGVEDMGVFGNSGKYSMVIAEKEEESPWEPLHVQQGFNREDNTISLFFPNYEALIMPEGTDDKSILNAVTYNIIAFKKGLFCLLIPPVHAKTLASKGWSKLDIQHFISEFARAPAYRHPGYWRPMPSLPPKELLPLNPTDSMRILYDPEWIRIVVAGGPGNFVGLYAGELFEPIAGWVTKKAELPANWNKLVNKYKDVVPTYVLY